MPLFHARLASIRAASLPAALAAVSLLACASSGPPPAGSTTVAAGPADTIVTPSGLKYYYLERGDGPRPRTGERVLVHGIGSFPSGEVFWNSREEERPFPYVMGSGRAIAGFVEAMDSLRVGDRAVVIMKPELAYGDRQRGDIPPNSTLIFDYEVLSVEPAGGGGAPPADFPGVGEIRETELRDDLRVLAGDGFRGRETTTLDELAAAAWTAERARAAGLEPAGEHGTWFQWFSLRGVRTSPATRIRVDGTPLDLGAEAVVMSPAEADVDDAVLWLGAATAEDTARHDVRGRVVAVEAGGGEAPSPAVLASRYYMLRTIREAARPWLERGAAAVVVVADSNLEPLFERAAAYAARGRVALEEGQPLDLGPEAQAPTILVRQASGPLLRRGGARLRADLRVDHYTYPSVNVVARVPGSDARLRGQHVLFSSHTDHDGVRATVRGDSIMNGADDNASVSVALLAIGRAFARHPARRSALFVWHGAEERGLHGSKWHATHPVVPLDSIVAVLNGDMIGRNHPDSAALLGMIPPHRNSTPLVEAALDANRRLTGFAVDSTWDRADHPEGWYFRSDHVHYAQLRVPALMFTSLLHEDYHSQFDGPDRIDYGKLARMTTWMYGTGWTVANADARPTIDEGFQLERTR